MGNSAYGLGWHNGNEEGYKNGYIDGESNGLIKGVIRGIAGTLFTLTATIVPALILKNKNDKKKTTDEIIETYKNWEIYKRSDGIVDAAKDDEVITADDLETLYKMIDDKENDRI